MTRPVVCITPVKNESWLLDFFIRAASNWADHILIADQLSDDGSQSIAERYPKVTLIANPSITFNEPERQALLISEARKRWPDAVLMALDADEALTPNVCTSPEWKAAIAQPPGTVLRMRWVNVRPGFESCWRPPRQRFFGYVDDGEPHAGQLIHSPRVPIPARAKFFDLENVEVLHFQYVDEERMQSKHRWYQCYERTIAPTRSATKIYRQYHHMDAIPDSWNDSLPPTLWEELTDQGANIATIAIGGPYRWDRDVLELFRQYGPGAFRREDIWRAPWKTLRSSLGLDAEAYPVDDPRSQRDISIQNWLRRTQRLRRWPHIRLADAFLDLIWR